MPAHHGTHGLIHFGYDTHGFHVELFCDLGTDRYELSGADFHPIWQRGCSATMAGSFVLIVVYLQLLGSFGVKLFLDVHDLLHVRGVGLVLGWSLGLST